MARIGWNHALAVRPAVLPGAALLERAPAVFAVFAGDYQQTLIFAPQKSWSWGHVARERTAGLVLFADHCRLDAHRFVAIKSQTSQFVK
jgi:hypothetical protein